MTEPSIILFDRVYQPGFMDMVYPTIIQGVEIKPGTAVKVTGPVGDPQNRFIYIEDAKGNRQSIDRKSLRA